MVIGFQLQAGIPERTILASFALPAVLAAIALLVMSVFNRPATERP
jgi:hypothetical protein